VLAQYAFLTVIAQPAYQMGQKAVELLLQRLQDEAPPEYRQVILPTHLIVRGSVGLAPDARGSVVTAPK
ncbi:MAG: substrate-binding domain-containing protein, partial [Anaerolineae bacterium]|nr:substrate-binding domain-containing protein [Anaerolineae bacterium]